MAAPTIAIIDYGAGNLRSVAKAFEAIGYPGKVTTDPADVLKADAVVLPGVGAAGDTMTSLDARGMVTAIKETIGKGKPFFGVCLGLQLLFENSEEGETECLGILPGKVRHFPRTVKAPHMGWNQVRLKGKQALFDGVPDGTNFYFVHSYYAEPADTANVAGETDYGVTFCSVYAKHNLVATQFHPEKSGDLGVKLYENFVKNIVGAGSRRR
jgi:glutamine amidotransferase